MCTKWVTCKLFTMNNKLTVRNILFPILLVLVCAVVTSFKPANPKTIHVYVALCDNVHQGIVPVPSKLGNGEDPFNNLYWGAMYGVKTFFKRKDSNWELIKTIKNPKTQVLEQVLFKHESENCYLLAEAYKGKEIKACISDFFVASSGKGTTTMDWKGQQLSFGSKASLLAYVGHDGLMEFDISTPLQSHDSEKRKAIMLACISKDYFAPYLKKTGASPLLWTTGLMAPEAYTLEAAVDAWLLGKEDTAVRQSAAEAYNKYQKCGINGAKRLLVTGW